MARAKREKFSPEDLLCRSIVVESRCSVPAGCQGWSQAAELHDAGKDGGSQQRRPLDGRVGGAPLGERPQPSPTALRRRHRAHHASIYPSESLPCLPDASCVVQPCSPDLGPGGLSASASAPGASCFPSGPCGIGLRATSAEARIQVAVLAGGHGGHGSGDLLGSIDWSLEFWGKTLYPARDAHLVRLHHEGEDGRRFFFFGCRLLQKMSGRCGPVNGRNSAAMCYLQATHMPYAPGLCPSCPKPVALRPSTPFHRPPG